MNTINEDKVESLIVQCIQITERAWKRTGSCIVNEGICITMLANTLLQKSLEDKKLEL